MSDELIGCVQHDCATCRDRQRELDEAHAYADGAARDRVLQSVRALKKRGLYDIGICGPFIYPAAKYLQSRGLLEFLPKGKIRLFDEPQAKSETEERNPQ